MRKTRWRVYTGKISRNSPFTEIKCAAVIRKHAMYAVYGEKICPVMVRKCSFHKTDHGSPEVVDAPPLPVSAWALIPALASVLVLGRINLY